MGNKTYVCYKKRIFTHGYLKALVHFYNIPPLHEKKIALVCSSK